MAQGTPADMKGLADVIEEGLRFPGFAFINVQSPCVTYGQPERSLKAQKAMMESLLAFKRAGCDAILTYFAPDVARALA